MAQPTPPPYVDVTGIARTDMKINKQETIAEYDGNARPGELVVDLTTYNLYIGNADGNLNGFSGGGGTNYANANAVAYGAIGWAGNIIPAANNVYSLGSPTRQWASIYVSAATLYLGNTAVSSDGTGLVVGGEAVVTANTPVTGNVAADYFIGDGSLLTNLPAGNYSNSNVAAYLPTYSGNVTTITATGNISASLFIGNGSQLTGVATSAALTATNANVSNTNSNVANLTTSLSNTNSNVANTNSNVANLSTSVTNTNSNVANTNANVANTNSNVANLSTSVTNTNSNVSNLTTSLSNTNSNVANVAANVTSLSGNVYNNSNVAAFLLTATGNISANYFVGNGSLLTGITATASLAGNLVGNIDANTFSINNLPSLSVVGNIQGNYFVGNGSQLTGITATANTGNIEITGTLIEIAAGATETSIVISPSGPTGGQAFVDVPDNATANTANLRIYNSLGNIELGTNSGNSSWYFDNTGNLTLPTNGAVNFAGGGIKQALNEHFTTRASDDESDGWSIYNIVDDGAGNDLTQTRLEYNQYSVRTNIQGASPYTWVFRESGDLELPNNLIGNVGNSLTIKIGDQSGSDTFIDLQTRSYVGDALISNIHIAPNVTISTANAAYNWTFGNTGNLTFPDTTVQSTAWTGTTDSIANTGNSFTMSSSGVLSLAEGANTYLTLDRFGITADTQMTLQAANSATGNNSAILFDRNGGGIAFRLEDVVANVPGSYNWGFYHSNVLFPDSTRQYTAYPGNATALSLSGNITADYFVGNGSLLTGITASANTGNVTFSDITIQGSNGLQLSAGPDFTANSAYLQVRSGDQPSHIHLDTGDNSTYDLLVGDDNKYVQIGLGGNISIASYAGNATQSIWNFDTAGNLVLPTISLGSGIDEQTSIQSQRKLIPPFRWSAVIANTTPTVVYTATSVNTTSMKVTIQVQHQGLGFEFFEVFATYTGSTNTYYVVNNRVAPPTIDPTTAEVSLTGSNVMEIILTINSGAAASWVTYDAVEFGIPND